MESSDIIVAYQKQLSLTEKRLKRERESLKVIQQSKQALEDTSAQLANKISVSDLIGDQSEPLDSNSIYSSLSEKRQAEIDLLKTQAQEEAGIQERIYKDEQLHYDKRLEAFEKFREAQEKLLSLQYGADREELDVRLAAGKIDRATYEAVAQNLDLSEMIAFDDLRREQEEAGKELMESIGKGMIEQARQSGRANCSETGRGYAGRTARSLRKICFWKYWPGRV